MSTLVLIALLAAAWTLQARLDTRRILALARERRWSAPSVRWSKPWKAWLRSRWIRSYRLRYRDESGRALLRTCWVGPGGIELDPPHPQEPAPRQPLPPLGLAARLLLGLGLGAFVGGALGIAGSLALVPSSNILPAYGLLLGTPLGAVVGTLAVALRSRGASRRRPDPLARRR